VKCINRKVTPEEILLLRRDPHAILRNKHPLTRGLSFRALPCLGPWPDGKIIVVRDSDAVTPPGKEARNDCKTATG